MISPIACSTGLMVVIITMFFRRELFSSRFIILAGWFLAIVYIVAARTFIRWLQRRLYAQGVGIHKIVIVGNTPTTEKIIRLISQSDKLGLKIVKRLKDADAESMAELTELMKARAIDEVIQIDPNLSRSDVLKILSLCEEHHIAFKYAADLLGTKILHTEVSMLAGVPIVEVKATPLDGWGSIIKRLTDIVVAALLIILSSPVLILTALAIKLESRGPVFYRNERVSKNGYFTLLKFRSMYIQYCIGEDYDNGKAALEFERKLIEAQNSKQGPVYKIASDPRVTRVGRFIRRWSIDELPQFFNVLGGTMSIVGPRPHQPREVEHYQRHHRKVLAIQPGITGLAQISGRSDLTFEEEVRLDTYYIENWTWPFDVGIILRTPFAVLRQRKVE